MRDAFRVVLLDLLADASGGRFLLLRCHLFVSSLFRGRLRARACARLLRTLARARVGARALTTHRQPATVTHAAIAAEVHQPLDAHRDFTAQVALDRELADLLAQPVHLRIGEILDLAGGLHARGRADGLRARTADA